MNFEDAIGKMCLIKSKNRWINDVIQVEILKLSPNERYVKYRKYHDNICTWVSIYSIELLDVLDE